MMKRLAAAFAAFLCLSVAVPASAQAVDPIARGLAALAWRPAVSKGCGTVTVSTPCLTITETWNNGSAVFGAPLTVNVTNTASAAGSLLEDLQVGGASQFSVDKAGNVYVGSASAAIIGYGNAGRITFNAAASCDAFGNSANASRFGYCGPAGGPEAALVGSAMPFGWTSTTAISGLNLDVALWRDAANTLALRNGTNAQCFNIANSYTDGSNYEYGKICWASNLFQLITSSAGTGSVRGMQIGTTGSANVNFITNNTNRWQMDSSGNFVGLTAGAYVLTAPTTVSSLPTCNTAAKGARAFVTDANATTFLSAVAGGGSNNVPAVCDGTSWKIG